MRAARCARNPLRARLRLREATKPRTHRNAKPASKGGLAYPARSARRRACYRTSRPSRRLTILNQKADLAVDAKHRDLIVFDNDFGILDPKRTDAAQGLRCLANGLAAGVVKPVRRLRDDLDIPYDRHRPLLPLYFARAKHERKETRPPSLGFAADASDRENIGRARDAHDEGC